jgi:hypothetical protein
MSDSATRKQDAGDHFKALALDDEFNLVLEHHGILCGAREV